MPATFIAEVIGDRGQALFEVRSPNGTHYTANPAHVVDASTGRQMLRQKRAEELSQQGYEVSLLSSGQYRIYCERKHGQQGGYRLTPIGQDEFTCNCPAFEKEGECKHSLGLPGLLFAKASAAARAGKPGHATTYVQLAGSPARIGEVKTTLQERMEARGLRPLSDFP